MVEIQIHAGQMAKLVERVKHIENGVKRVLVPSINRALASGKTVIKKEIREHYVIKAKDIPMTVSRSTYGAATVGGSIKIQQGMLDLGKFNVKPRGVQRRKNKKPIWAQVKKGGGGFIKSAFYIPAGGPYSRIGPSRFPIFKLKTISAAIMATQPSVGPAANKKMGDTLDKRLDHELKRVLAGA